MPVRAPLLERVETETNARLVVVCSIQGSIYYLSEPMQTSLIQNAHGDLVTDAAYDFYGVRLATCSLDHRIKVWQLDESDGNWTPVADWKVRVSPPPSCRRVPRDSSYVTEKTCPGSRRRGDETFMGASGIRFCPCEFLV
jgi:WD40 repeat protein